MWLWLAVSLYVALLASLATAAESRAGLTLIRTITAPTNLNTAQPIELFNLVPAQAVGDADSILRLTWKTAQIGWFATWQLFLSSDAGLVPAELMGQAKQGIQVGPVAPVLGHDYEAALSYDPETGLASVSVYDVQDAKYLYRGEWTIGTYAGPLVNVSEGHVTQLAMYQPVSARWDPVIQTEFGGFVAVRLIERNEPAWIRAEVPDPRAGQLDIVVRTGETEQRFHLGQVAGGPVSYPFDPGQLPAGPISATLQYRVDEALVWESRPRALTVGRLGATLENAAVDPSLGVLNIDLALRSDGPLANLTLQLETKAHQLAWDLDAYAWREAGGPTNVSSLNVGNLSGNAGVVSVAIPLAHDPGLSRLQLALTSEPPVLIDFVQSNLLLTPNAAEVMVTAGDFRPFKGSVLNPTSPSWEAEVAAIEQRYAHLDPAQGTVVFIGSSSIRGWRTLPQDFPGMQSVNSGFGGSQIVDSIYYADRLVVPFAPHTIVFYAGSNDVSAGKHPTQVFTDYVAFVERVHAELPNTKIIFISIAPSPSRWSQRFNVQDANEMIRLFTETDERLEYLDVYSLMLGADGTPQPDLYISDQLHMTPKGYALWREALAQLLLELEIWPGTGK